MIVPFTRFLLPITATFLLAPNPAHPEEAFPSAAEIQAALDTMRRLERALDEISRKETERDDGAQGLPPVEPRVVPVPGNFSLSLAHDLNVGGALYQDGLPWLHVGHSPSGLNSAFGVNALISLTEGNPQAHNGTENTAIGFEAMTSLTGGYSNTALGKEAMEVATTTVESTAVGAYSGALLEQGERNTLLGAHAGGSLGGGSVDDNTAVGHGAGFAWEIGSDNIAIGSGVQGNVRDNGVIRIGLRDIQTKAFISGISGATTGLNDAVPVLIDTQGQLGVVSSSRRYKEDIEDLGDVSDGFMALRPVQFRYARPFDDGSKPIQYGLVAEEVAQVLPDLVIYDPDGRPETVKHHLLTPLLLAQLQQARRDIVRLESELDALRERLPQ